ncbi:MAG: hypothetical protein RL514_1887 [Verrucomicrobiota bacterium]|jgi:hypothetical protein
MVVRNPNGTSPATLNRADLITMRTNLTNLHTAIQGQINSVELAAADLKTMKEFLHLRGGQFNAKVRAVLGGTSYDTALPELPTPTDGMGVFVPPLDDILTLWTKINAAVGLPGFTAPLLLLGGYTLAEYTTALANLKLQFELVAKEQLGVTLKIGDRNGLQDVIYPVLKAYRQTVPVNFAANSPLVSSLPRLTPEPGSTPDAVLANGAWNAPTTQAKLSWSEPTSPDVVQVEVRWSPGPTYDASQEVVLANLAPTDPREHSTTQGLLAIGDVSNFKIYVLTSSGHERGSNTVKITRTT